MIFEILATKVVTIYKDGQRVQAHMNSNKIFGRLAPSISLLLVSHEFDSFG